MLPLLLTDIFMYLYHYKKETFIIEKKMYGHGKKKKKKSKAKKIKGSNKN